MPSRVEISLQPRDRIGRARGDREVRRIDGGDSTRAAAGGRKFALSDSPTLSMPPRSVCSNRRPRVITSFSASFSDITPDEARRHIFADAVTKVAPGATPQCSESASARIRW